MTLSAKGRRTKGHNFERWLARYFTSYGLPAERNLEYQSQHKGDVNIQNHPDIMVQAKDQKKPNMKKALEQARDDMQGHTFPIAICHFINEPKENSIVSMYLSDFIKLLARK